MFGIQPKMDSENTDPILSVPTTCLGFEYNLELSSWHNGFDAYRVYENGKREEIEGNLGLGLQVLQDYAADSCWLSQIPELFQNQTNDFPDLQFYILWLAANSTKAAQLLQCRPLILVLICNAYPADKDRALVLCEKGQREILRELGFDGSNAALKFIDKLRLTYQTGVELGYVKRYLHAQKKEYLKFKHYPVINDLTLSVDRTLPLLTGTKLGIALASVKQRKVWGRIGYVKDTMNLGADLGIVRARDIICNLNSLEELIAIHDQWTEQRIVRRNIRPSDAHVPYPWIVDVSDEQLIQIKNYDELLKESTDQIHCIVTYHSRIAEGRYLAFKMETPERVTIGVRINLEIPGNFEVDQIKCKRNQEPTESTKMLIFKLVKKIKFRYR